MRVAGRSSGSWARAWRKTLVMSPDMPGGKMGGSVRMWVMTAATLAAGVGQVPGEQLEGGHGEGVAVGGRGGLAPPEQLGGAVGRGAEELPGVGEAGRHGLGDAEVHELDPAVLGHEDVVGLDVPVDDGVAVGGAQGPHGLDQDAEARLQVQAVVPDELAQAVALDVLHGDEGPQGRLLAHVETVTMFGWFSWAEISASRLNRSRAWSRSSPAARTTLMASRRFSRGSSAR